MALGATIRAMRIAKEWRLEDLSERSGVDVGTISALENRDSTRSKYAAPIAKALGCTVDDLVNGDVEAAGGAAHEAARAHHFSIGPVDLSEAATYASTEDLRHIKELADKARLVIVRLRGRIPQGQFFEAMQSIDDLESRPGADQQQQ